MLPFISYLTDNFPYAFFLLLLQLGNIPVLLKRELIENWLLAKRASEEIHYVREEMTQVESYYQRVSNALDICNTEFSQDENRSRYDAGLENIIKMRKHACHRVQEALARQFSMHQSGDIETEELIEEMYFSDEEEDIPDDTEI